VDFDLHFVDSINTTLAEEELAAGEFSFVIDPAVVSVAQRQTGLDTWVLVVIVVCVLFVIICVVLLVLVIRATCYRRTTSQSTEWTDSASDSDQIRPFNFPKPGLLVWQDSESLRKLSGGIEAQRMNESEKLRPIHHAFTKSPLVVGAFISNIILY
jgi:hypothetical protein